jgi:hypothetical protein
MLRVTFVLMLVSVLAACGGAPAKGANTGCAPPPAPTAAETLSLERLREVAKRLAGDCLRRPWLAEHVAQFKRKPVVRLHPLKDKTLHLVDLHQLGSLLERELMARVQIVASIEDAEKVRRIREQEAEHSSDAAARLDSRETGAEYILTGTAVELEDAVPGGKVRAYVFTVELLDAADASKVWVGKHVEKLLIKSKGPGSDICR